MIENLVRVTAREGHNVTVTAVSLTGCARCDAGEGCGGGVFGKLVRRRLEGLQLDDAGLDVEPGQLAVIGLDDGVFLRVTLLTYGLPLLGLLLGAALGMAVGGLWARSDPISAVGGTLGLVLGMWLAPRWRDGVMRLQAKPRLLRQTSPAQWECSNNAG